jgi:hypothetical protein
MSSARRLGHPRWDFCERHSRVDSSSNRLIFQHNVIQTIRRNLTASDFERIQFYRNRIRNFGRDYSQWDPMDIEDQVLSIIWSRKPFPGPLLPNVSEVDLEGNYFDGLAIQPRLIIGPQIRSIRLRTLSDSLSWVNVTAMLRKAAPLDLSSFSLLGYATTLSWSESESLELLSTLHGVGTLSIMGTFLTTCAISLIATFPALEDLRLSVTETEMENYAPLDNNFPAITNLEISSETIDACNLMLLKIQSRTFRSLTVTRIANNYWDVGSLFMVLHGCNSAASLETLNVCEGPWYLSTSEELFSENPPAFKVDARILEHLDSFEHLSELQIHPCSNHLDDNDLMKLAQSLPRLRSLDFWSQNNGPRCTFTGMQHLIRFCPKLERLTLCVDARQIPIFATQPDGEYPLGLHLTTLAFCQSPVLTAGAVASYLTMLLPVLTDFRTIDEPLERGSEEEREVIGYRKIWWKVAELLGPLTKF